jgi:hypothetical protein
MPDRLPAAKPLAMTMKCRIANWPAPHRQLAIRPFIAIDPRAARAVQPFQLYVSASLWPAFLICVISVICG